MTADPALRMYGSVKTRELSMEGMSRPCLLYTSYECVMLMNESIGTAIHDKVRFTSLQPALEYDAYENCLYQIMTCLLYTSRCV